MTPQQIFATALRLFAIWLLVASFKYLVFSPRELAHLAEWNGVTTSVIIGVLMLAVAAVLWFFPLSIAYKFVPRASFGDPVSLQPLEAARVGCALIGLWFFADGLLSITWYVLIFATQGAQGVQSEQMTTFFFTLIKMAAGIALMAGGGMFARLVVRGQKG